MRSASQLAAASFSILPEHVMKVTHITCFIVLFFSNAEIWND